jgi:hypothetical protein
MLDESDLVIRAKGGEAWGILLLIDNGHLDEVGTHLDLLCLVQ